MVKRSCLSFRQARAWLHAVRSTMSDRGMISPVSSATEMNSSGWTRVPSSRRQRTSASAPVMRFPGASTLGW